MTLRGPSRRFAVALPAVLSIWCFAALAGLLARNPFQVAKDAAAVAGGWSPDSVRFDRGSYQYRLLYSVAAADVTVATDAGHLSARIELLHVPFRGWSVRRFDSSRAPGQAASHRR